MNEHVQFRQHLRHLRSHPSPQLYKDSPAETEESFALAHMDGTYTTISSRCIGLVWGLKVGYLVKSTYSHRGVDSTSLLTLVSRRNKVEI
jgi:hypothetical protein